MTPRTLTSILTAGLFLLVPNAFAQNWSAQAPPTAGRTRPLTFGQ